jgi:transcriptional regulator with XRE-family HTH domain
MSQQVFADRLGKSKSWVDKVERGVRRLDKYSTIAEIAQVLQVDVAEFTGGREQARRPEVGLDGVGKGEVDEIRTALERYDAIRPFYIAADNTMPLTELQKSVDHAWMAFQHANYMHLAKSLPRLIIIAQSADGTGRDDTTRGGAYLLAEVYQIASSTLLKLGERALAWIVADRAAMVCQRAGDDLLAALSTDQVAAALGALERVRPALDLSVAVAERLAPGPGQDVTPAHLSVYGTVLLRGAMAAARLGDAGTVRRLLGAAEDAAKQVGDDENHYWTSFGPTNVAFCQVAAELELGEADRALRTHAGIDPEVIKGMVTERRASHQITVARACLQVGDTARACEALVTVKRSAPSELRFRPDAQELVAELVRRSGGVAQMPGLREIADEIGFPGAAA